MSKVEQMKDELLNRYEYIEKLDAIKLLKSIYGDKVELWECRDAWELAYND